jgi:DNA-binding MarR family transcriptional regulator
MTRRGQADPGQDERDVADDEVEAVLRACRVLVAISASSLAAVDELADVTQARVLVMLASRGPLSLSALAESADLHVSTASRLCDRMTARGLLARAADADDRRLVVFSLTPAGRRIVRTVATYRRDAIRRLLAELTPDERTDTRRALSRFAEAGGEPLPPHALWSLGWAT